MLIKLIFNRLPKFISFIFHFNPLFVLKKFTYPVIWYNKPIYDQWVYKHNLIKQYLKNKFKDTISSFEGKSHEVDPSLANNYPIWFCWWQGEDRMPPIVKTCFNALKYYSNGHNVNLVTKDNYQNFVTLPDYIIKKAEKKLISFTHLSDVLRICLLYENGGLWLDSTVLVTAPLCDLPPICSRLGFWTPKDDGNILEVCNGARNWIVREDKWLTFCFYLSKHNILAEFVRTMFFTYIKTYNIFIDYFLFDYFISIAYDTLPEIRTMIDSVPDNNPKIHEIQHKLILNNEFNKILFDEICSNTIFHKLSWKENNIEYTENGKLTNYCYILNNFPPI
ncbi:MAG: capsular polysaccharide synthesis protein [Treponema sp.]|jgi:hypothetical protein|nr:capsular polysaccharide synthesis protein [Treponema sp.]